MRKSVAVVSTVLLAVGVLTISVEAKSRHERTVTGSYRDAGLRVGSFSLARPIAATLEIPAGPERYLKVDVEDETGGDVYAEFSQDLDGDGSADLHVPICTSTVLPIFIEPNTPSKVIVYQGPCFNGNTARASAGTITATLSNRP